MHLAEERGKRLEKQQRGGLRSCQTADGEGPGQAPGGGQAPSWGQAGCAPTQPRGLSPPQTYSRACARGGSRPRGSASRARGGGWDLAEPRGVRTPKGLSAPLIWGASRASAAKGVSKLSPSPVSMVTCSAPIQTAVLY